MLLAKPKCCALVKMSLTVSTCLYPKLEHNLHSSSHTCVLIMSPCFITENTATSTWKQLLLLNSVVVGMQGNRSRIKAQRDILACAVCLCLGQGADKSCSLIFSLSNLEQTPRTDSLHLHMRSITQENETAPSAINSAKIYWVSVGVAMYWTLVQD